MRIGFIAILFLSFMQLGCSAPRKLPWDPNEQLMQNIPLTYVVKNTRDVPSRIKETIFMPGNQSQSNWTELLYVQIFFDRGSLTPGGYRSLMQQSWMKQSGTILQRIDEGAENGYPYSIFILSRQEESSNKMDGPSVSIFKAIKGKNGLYSIQKSYKNPLSKIEVDKYVDEIKRNILCSSNTEFKCPQIPNQ